MSRRFHPDYWWAIVLRGGGFIVSNTDEGSARLRLDRLDPGTRLHGPHFTEEEALNIARSGGVLTLANANGHQAAV